MQYFGHGIYPPNTHDETANVRQNGEPPIAKQAVHADEAEG